MGGAIAALAGSTVWILITTTTGIEIGYVAIGAAWLVGMTIRRFKASKAPAYGYLGAAFSLLAIVFGDAGTIVASAAAHDRIGFFAELAGLDPAALLHAMIASSSLMTIVFYVIAVVAGYRVAMGSRAAPGGPPPAAA